MAAATTAMDTSTNAAAVAPRSSLLQPELSPDLSRLLVAEAARARAAEEAAAAVAAAAAAASASAHHGDGFFTHKTIVGAPPDVASKPFSFADQFVAQQSILRLAYDCIGRIRAESAQVVQQQKEPNILTPNTRISPADLTLMHSLFGKDFVHALDIVDRNFVTTCAGEGSGRVYWLVKSGHSGDTYTTTQFHCTCPAFNKNVIVGTEHLFCKHQLAGLIADALHRGHVTLVPDNVLGDNLAKTVVTDNAHSGWRSTGGWGGGRGRGRAGGGGGGGGGGGDGGWQQQQNQQPPSYAAAPQQGGQQQQQQWQPQPQPPSFHQ